MPLTPQEKKGLVRQFAENPEALEAMFDALEAYRDGHWTDSPFVQQKREALQFVRGISQADLNKLTASIHAIKSGHSFSKHFTALRDFTIVKPNKKRLTIKRGTRFEIVGHGWSNPEPGVYLHPFTLWEHDVEIGDVDISDTTLSKLLKEGKIQALP